MIELGLAFIDELSSVVSNDGVRDTISANNIVSIRTVVLVEL